MGHTDRHGASVHLHHVRTQAVLPARPRGAQGHQPLLLPRGEDRRHRIQRVWELVTAPDHGGRGRWLHGRGPAHAGIHRGLPGPGASAGPVGARNPSEQVRRPSGTHESDRPDGLLVAGGPAMDPRRDDGRRGRQPAQAVQQQAGQRLRSFWSSGDQSAGRPVWFENSTDQRHQL